MHQELAKKGLVVIGVAIDKKLEPVKKFAKDKKLTYILATDPKAEVFKAYGVEVPPGIFLVDRKRIVQVAHVPFSGVSMEQVQRMMKEQPEKVQQMTEPQVKKVPEEMKELKQKVKELLTKK